MTKLKKDGTPSRQGEGGGKAPTFKSEEEFLIALKEYLADCAAKERMPNIAGFAAFKGIDRDIYYVFAKKYAGTKKAFEASIEDTWLQNLSGAHAVGSIFYLKNAFREHYKDRTETDFTSGGKPFPILGGKSVSDVSRNNGRKKDSRPQKAA